MSEWYKSKEQVQIEADIAEKQKRLRFLKKSLDETDHKQFNDYEPKEGEDVEAIKEQRREWRREVRELIKELLEQES